MQKMYVFISDEPSIAIQFQFSLFHSNRQRDMRYLYIYNINKCRYVTGTV